MHTKILQKRHPNDAGLIRTDASEENRFLVYRIRPLCHCALRNGRKGVRNIRLITLQTQQTEGGLMLFSFVSFNVQQVLLLQCD